MRSLLQKLEQRWQKDKLATKPGVSENALSAFQDQHQVKLPSDFAMFFKVFDGMGDGETDDELNRFLPIDEVYPIEDPSLPARCFVFMDCSLSAYLIAICLDGQDSNRVFRVGEHDPIAGDFQEFIQLYLQGRHLKLENAP